MTPARAGLNRQVHTDRVDAAAQELGVVRQLQVVRQTQVLELPLNDIDVDGPWNPRGQLGGEPYGEMRLEGLMAAIEEVGQLSPVLVRPHPDGPQPFQLVMGWRRYHSRRLLGHQVVLAQVGNFRDDQLELIATMENTQREELEQFETVRGVFRVLASRLQVEVVELPMLMNRVLKQQDDPHHLREQLAMLSSQSLSTFATKYARVLKLLPAEQKAVYERQISSTVALELVRLDDRPERPDFLRRAIEEQWSTRQTAAYVRSLLTTAADLDGAGSDRTEATLVQLARTVKRQLSKSTFERLSPAQLQTLQTLLSQVEATLKARD